MTRTMNRLAVYCGSASPQDPRFIQLAYDVGKGLAQRGIGVVYGGGRLGLMGATARGALEAGELDAKRAIDQAARLSAKL